MEETVLKEFRTMSLKIFKYVIGCIMASAVFLGYVIKVSICMPVDYILTSVSLVCLAVLEIIMLFLIICSVYKLAKKLDIIK